MYNMAGFFHSCVPPFCSRKPNAQRDIFLYSTWREFRIGLILKLWIFFPNLFPLVFKTEVEPKILVYIRVLIFRDLVASDPDPGSDAFQTLGSGSGMNILETVFGFKKKLNFFYADPDPWSGIFFTLDPGYKNLDLGSRIRWWHPGSATLLVALSLLLFSLFRYNLTVIRLPTAIHVSRLEEDR